MDRMYSTFTVKTVDEDQRVIRGVATTPTPDRMGDVVEPLGIVFANPVPLLHHHDRRLPVGTVKFDKPTKNGMNFEAVLPKITEAGPLKDRVDTAWGEIKAGLIRAVSIGFRMLEYAVMDGGGWRYIATDVYELSLVTIPANAEATITSVKSFDLAQRAASGRSLSPVVRLIPPGASGNATRKSTEAKEAKDMKTIAEQIAAFEAKRAANVAKMQAVMQKSIDEGRSTEEAEQEEFDGLEREVAAIDKDLDRLRKVEKAMASTARPVVEVRSVADGSATRGGNVVVRAQPKLEPGVAFARLAKVKAVARLDGEPALKIAERMYGPDSDVVGVIKANEVVTGSNISGNWAAKLTGAETSAFADFAAYLRPATILGKFGAGAIPALRHVPFREPLISQTGGGAAYWVGEGKPTPLTAFDFNRTTLEPLKIGNIAVLTEENVRSSNPSSELIVRDALRDAIVAGQDVAFVDPANNGTTNVKPASITNGAATIASTGTDADAIRVDVRAVFHKFIEANNAPSAGVWLMSSKTALALSLMTNALGQKEFPGLSMTGGTFEGLPAIISDHIGSIVILVNASDIYVGDDGEVSVDMSREASLEMKSATLTQDSTAGTGASLVSLWQGDLVGLKAQRTINWKKRRASAVAYLTGVQWGGAVPAS
jgi:HK97 family phage prohead protease